MAYRKIGAENVGDEHFAAFAFAGLRFDLRPSLTRR